MWWDSDVGYLEEMAQTNPATLLWFLESGRFSETQLAIGLHVAACYCAPLKILSVYYNLARSHPSVMVRQGIVAGLNEIISLPESRALLAEMAGYDKDPQVSALAKETLVRWKREQENGKFLVLVKAWWAQLWS